MAKEDDSLITAIGVFAGNSAKGNFDIELKFLFTEENLSEALQFVAGIGRHLKLIAIVNKEKVRLGTWGVYKLSVDRNAQTTVVFKTNKDDAFVENLSQLMVEDEEIEIKARIV